MGDLLASGQEFTLKNVVVQRTENSKSAETWISWGNVALLRQLGHFPTTLTDLPQDF